MNDGSSFIDQAWAATADIRVAIEDHPFLTSLRAGTLDRAVFVEYLAQDSHYLIGYARALALCASQADETDDISFWATAAHDAVMVERTLHANWISAPDSGNAREPSPTCRSYLDFLLATAGQGSYPVLAAALTPCFWIYEDVGSRLKMEVRLDGHPYADWIQTYGDPAFAEATERVKGIVNTVAKRCSQDLRDRMLSAFRTATRYEWMFWDAAWRRESWSEFGPAAPSRVG